MILCRQISDVIANENARYKRNELESQIKDICYIHVFKFGILKSFNYNKKQD